MKYILQYLLLSATLVLLSDYIFQVVSIEEGETLAKEFKIPFFETSALNNINVDDAFMKLSKEVKIRLASEDVNKSVKKGPTKKAGPSASKPLDNKTTISTDNVPEKKKSSWCSIL